MQLELFAPPAAALVSVFMRCPACGYRWLGAMLEPGAWWAVSPAQCAKHPYCPKCDDPPPMELA